MRRWHKARKVIRDISQIKWLLGVRKASQVFVDFIGYLLMVRRINIGNRDCGVSFPHVTQVPNFLMPTPLIQLLEFSHSVYIVSNFGFLNFTDHLIAKFCPVLCVTLSKRSLTMVNEVFNAISHPGFVSSMWRHRLHWKYGGDAQQHTTKANPTTF